MKKFIVALLLGTAIFVGSASAQTTFNAILLGAAENPPNASPASGFGTVVLNAAQSLITVNENWTGLVAPASASHIHGPTNLLGNAPVIFTFSGVPAATSGAIPTQSFAITAAQVTDLFNGLYYMNIHDSVFPGGEIRGQLILVPEPSALACLGLGAVGMGARAWNKRRANKA